MFPRLTVSTTSLLSVMVVFNAISSPIEATFSGYSVIKVFEGSASAALPDSAGKGLNFECGRHFARQVYREYHKVTLDRYTGSIGDVKAYTVKNCNKVKEEMNLVKVTGPPFSFFMKKLGEDNFAIIVQRPDLDCDFEGDSSRVRNINDI